MALPAAEGQGAPDFPHFLSAVDAVRGLTIKGPHPKPKTNDRRAVHPGVGMPDIPLVPCGGEMNAVISFCDVIMDVQGPLDASVLFILCEKGQWASLPAPLSPKRPLNVPYTLQIVIAVDGPGAVAQDNPNDYTGKYHVCKHYTLHGGKIAVSRIAGHCHGRAMRFDYGNFCRVGGAAVQHMLFQLRGLQITAYDVGPRCERRAFAGSDRAVRESGYKHIPRQWPSLQQ